MNKIRRSKFKIQNALFIFCIFNFALFALACSIPNLEDAACTQSRQTVKEFYSLHFGGEMRYSPEILTAREKYFTTEFAAYLPKSPTDADVFTVNSNDYPKAFRIGNCRAESSDKTILEVLLFWKTNERSEQRNIEVEMVRVNEQWRINKIKN
jgi:hypothetical protein